MITNHKPIFVNILGVDYPVKGDFKPEYIRQIAADLDRRIEKMARRLPVKSIEKAAVLTALNLEDELQTAKENKLDLLNQLEERIQGLSEKIDRALDESSGNASEPAAVEELGDIGRVEEEVPD